MANPNVRMVSAVSGRAMIEYHIVWWPSRQEWALLKERATADLLYIASHKSCAELVAFTQFDGVCSLGLGRAGNVTIHGAKAEGQP